ncbi:acyltransferase family protein [Pseudoclavibacter terrae]|uniref:Acyltransferase n=1 Tax=Pseudoclavibacter terrae TaxID=1530195 RepID=A0A7J5B2I2_9MICO|nr:acyltransferase [Pseudoclavibacter terrae]KAB1638223.1 acyltransferase [Pseudoclavibacter terrae]
MTQFTIPRTAASPEPSGRRGATASQRDAAVDLVRAVCLAVVLLLHISMAGVAVVSGDISITNAVEDEAWFAPVTWLLQVMPLFFIIGGFAARAQWMRLRARGGTSREFIVSRTRRLLVPALAFTAVVTLTLTVAALAGVDTALLAEASFRMTQPLWFLAVYLGVTALVPLMLRAHETAPHATLIALVSGAVLVDALRKFSGMDAVGVVNYAFVWLAIQQLGFFFSEWRTGTATESATWDAVARARRRRLPIALIVGGALAVVALVNVAGYSPELLLDNNNPASIALIALGAAQLGVLMLAHPPLTRVASGTRGSAFSRFVNTHSMRLYLWHMPVLVVVTAGLLTAGAWWPEPLSLEWFATRPLLIATVLSATALLMPIAARLEAPTERLVGVAARRIRGGRPSAPAAVWLGIAGVVTLLVFGFWPAWAGLLACVLMMLSLRVRTFAS